MWKVRLAALTILIAGIGVGYFVFDSEVTQGSRFPFKLGLDLAGGTHLVYRADSSELPGEEVADAMSALRRVIERRVNSRDIAGVAGVLDPVVQTEKSSQLSGVAEERLIVELPGVTDTAAAVALIGKTPLLEFKLVAEAFETQVSLVTLGDPNVIPNEGYIPTGLTGRQLKGAQLEFSQNQIGGLSNEPTVRVDFNDEGAQLFARITRENVGNYLAIFLDGVPISIPVIQSEITGGSAIITGSFTPEEARNLARDLDFGALPIPIELISTQTIGASLGAEALTRGALAGMYGLGAVALFMVLWYRLPGLFAVLSLAVYVAVVLAIFKLIPVTLTAAGVAGFILSVGMAVDANVLIFERMKEELRSGKTVRDAVTIGFSRAWLSIRDGNISGLITAVVIFYAGTFLTRGFAVTLAIGIIVSMLSAITFTRALLLSTGGIKQSGLTRFLFGSGIHI
ncbi:MAG TPA: protein translocase subunit SecD [Candidatus Paceibacterota bacterium]